MVTFKTAMIGDSHAKVVFRYLSKNLARLGFPVVYQRAENGWSLKKHINQGSLQEIKRAKPDLIIVSLGGNNHTINSEKYAKTVNKLLNLAKSMGSAVVWVGPTASDPVKAASTERRHKWTTKFLKSYLPPRKVFFFDSREWTGGGWKKDGVHYPTSLYKNWAKIVSSRLRRIRKKLKPKTSIQKIRKWAWIGGSISALTLLGLVSFKLATRNKGGKNLEEGNVIPLFPKKEMDEKNRKAMAQIAFANQFNISFPSWASFAKQAAQIQRINHQSIKKHPVTGLPERNKDGRYGPYIPIPLQIVETPINTVAKWAAKTGLELKETNDGFSLDVNPYSNRGQ